VATSVGDVLTPQLLDRLVAIGDGPAVRGVAVLGSLARGEATPWSDIDVESTLADPAAKWDVRPSFIGSRLVMSHSITPAEQWRALELPDQAIWAAPAFDSMRILLDRDGDLARLQDAGRRFDYESLRPAAAAFIRQRAPTVGEYVLKIRDGLERGDESKTVYATANLVLRCERLVAVTFLRPIRTENEYHSVIRAAAGAAWTALHRAACGLEGGAATALGTAACGLYRETMRIVDPQLDPASREIVRRVVDLTK
jgi:hypothetical protein